jgi:hypothetical protein
MPQFKVGQKIKLTGTITEVDPCDPTLAYKVVFDGGSRKDDFDELWITPTEMSHAEIIEEPVTPLTKEQVWHVKKIVTALRLGSINGAEFDKTLGSMTEE